MAVRLVVFQSLCQLGDGFIQLVDAVEAWRVAAIIETEGCRRDVVVSASVGE